MQCPINADNFILQSPAVSKTHRQSTSDAGQQPAKRHSTSGANGTASVDQHLPQISRKIKACAACRKHKVSDWTLGRASMKAEEINHTLYRSSV